MPLKGFGISGVNIFTDLLLGTLQQQAQERREREREAERRRQQQEEEERERQRQRFRDAQRVATELERERRRRRPQYDVIVIGCGASGIAALARLKEAGINAIGLEASDRMGGRINTVEFGAGVVDLGAAWCHGEVGNEVYRLANPHNLLGRPETNEERWYMYSDGTLLPTGNATSIENAIEEAVTRADKNNSISISNYIRDAIRRNDIRPWHSDVPITEPFIEWYERNQHLGGQDDPQKGKSLKGLVKNEVCPGEPWLNWKGQGYKKILDVLLKKHEAQPLDVNIQYNKKVVNINWMPLEVDPEYPFPVVDVTCADGTIIRGRSVIVSVSLGVLKNSYLTLFTPLLPPQKINAINNLQFCVLDKIYIEFTTPWWPDSYSNFMLLWRDVDKATFGDSEKWVTEIFGLRTVEHQPNVLLAWIYGEGAKQMEKVSPAELRAGVDKLLKIFELNFDVTPVKRVLRSQWASNDLIRGSYSYRAVTTETSSAGAESLSEPITNGGMAVVYFAGEATSHNHHNSVHGAIEAGFREADLVKTMPK